MHAYILHGLCKELVLLTVRYGYIQSVFEGLLHKLSIQSHILYPNKVFGITLTCGCLMSTPHLNVELMKRRIMKTIIRKELGGGVWHILHEVLLLYEYPLTFI